MFRFSRICISQSSSVTGG